MQKDIGTMAQSKRIFSTTLFTAVIFSLKNNFGWTDKVQSVNENKNTNANIDCSKLTDEQIDKILKGE